MNKRERLEKTALSFRPQVMGKVKAPAFKVEPKIIPSMGKIKGSKIVKK